jgi:hypothetical protein
LGELIPTGTGVTEAFTVQASDLAGASAILDVQPFFSTQAGGNGSILTAAGLPDSCGMRYDAGSSLLFVNDANGGNNWVGYSLSGGAWSGTNSNGVCQVNSWSVQPSGIYLTLYVNVTFLQAGTWYEYLSATNATGSTLFITNGLTWVAP